MVTRFQRSSAFVATPGQGASTIVVLSGLALTWLILPSDSVSEIFTTAAIVVGASIAVATCIEAMAGIRSLLRVDVLILWVLYGLTFFEFLFPQPAVDALLSPDAAAYGTQVTLVGFAGLVLGRHLVPRQYRSVPASSFDHVRSTNIFVLFVFAALIGYLHMLIAVNFDLVDMLQQMMLPRFSQSWARGKYGDAYSLLYELGLFIQLIPPLAGLIYGRGSEYTGFQKVIVAVILALTVFYGFASGTRSVIVAYAITFGGTYFLANRSLKQSRILLFGGVISVLLFFAVNYMLDFRNKGFSNFSSSEDRATETMFVDLNLINISKLTQLFPSQYDFLGFEIPFNALIRPIPRVLWPGKPEGLSTSIEEALGVSGMTLSCTFIGEMFMAGGLFAVLVYGLLFGAAATLWNRVLDNKNSSILLYTSGLVCAALSMRSVLQMVPAMLPTVVLWIYFRYWVPKRLGETLG